MSKYLSKTSSHYSEERKMQIEAERNRWRAVNYGETDSNIAKFNRQAESYGRIRYW
jgi:hypothetical protein